LKAGSLVHDLVCLQALHKLLDDVVARIQLALAVLRCCEVARCGREEVGTVRHVGTAGCVKNSHDAKKLSLSFKEASGCLEHHGEGVASFVRRVTEDAVEKRRTVAVRRG
jgi:hypothetical protein